MKDHWPLHARQWALVGPPLRPCADDVALVRAEVDAWSAGRAPRALLLGVTPELATMAWPPGTSLVAVDRSDAMIGAVFPRAGAPAGADAIRGHWDALPIADGSRDVVVGDGCLTCVGFPDRYRAIADEIARVLAKDGIVLLRLFAAPDRSETLDDVAADLRAGRIRSFHALKWRIAMAVQAASRNVAVTAILDGFETLVTDRAALAARTGWSLETIGTIDVYRGSDIVYSFPTVDETVATLAGALVHAASHIPHYELGDRCPTLVLRTRSR